MPFYSQLAILSECLKNYVYHLFACLWLKGSILLCVVLMSQYETSEILSLFWKEISSECLGPVNDCSSYGDKGLDDICLSNWGHDPGLRRISD